MISYNQVLINLERGEKMGGATKQISEYIRKKGFNLSEISRKTGVPYTALYDSVANEKRDRDLRVDEFLALCKHLELDPIIFLSNRYGKR